MELELKIADENDALLWDKVVESSSHGTIFHTWKWLKIVEKHTKCRLYPLIGAKESTIIGICPVFYQTFWGIKRVESPPPRMALPYLGPIIVDYDKFKQSKRESIYTEFIKNMDKFISSNLKPNYTYIALTPSLDPRPFKWTNYKVHALFDYNLNMEKGEEAVWQNFDKPARDHIKKANKENICFKEGTEEDLHYIYDSLVTRYKEQNKYVTVPEKYLFDIFNNYYPENMRIFIAKSGENNVGGIVSLLYKDTIYFWIGAAKSDLKVASPNDMIHWEGMRWGCNHGFKYYEETGANEERLCRFKSKYNPELMTRFTATKYSSYMYLLAEKAYTKVFKKVYGVLFK
ncbi:MAG: GNAT family N-acetyltransferase [Candidatus Methanoperedens sp.]|nr:GNAT family N-acetyltransferase [Candidatus Methanoperedens sp.]